MEKIWITLSKINSLLFNIYSYTILICFGFFPIAFLFVGYIVVPFTYLCWAMTILCLIIPNRYLFTGLGRFETFHGIELVGTCALLILSILPTETFPPYSFICYLYITTRLDVR